MISKLRHDTLLATSIKVAGPIFVLACCLPMSAAVDWYPVNRADLEMNAPRVEKDADAEALFWEVRVLDELDGAVPRAVLSHYIRIKIFTDRGREKQSTIDLPYLDRNKIVDIAGRTVKPNGEILELKKDAVYERLLVKAGGIKVKAKSFAMPGVEAGAIIEYRWREIRRDQLTNYVRLQFQREIPVQLVKYYIKPFSNPYFPYAMRSISFHMQPPGFTRESNGFASTYVNDVPAFKEEAYMPAEPNVRPWMLLYYSPDSKLDPDKYWATLSKELFQRYKSRIKINDEVRRAAQAAAGDAVKPEDKVRRVFEYVRSNVKNIHDDSSELSSEDKDRVKENKTPADTLKQKIGTGYEITLLFIAMVNGLDIDARLARLSDSSDAAFDKRFLNPFFLRTYAVAIKLGDAWKFCDPASPYLPYGMLRWQEEGQPALIADPKEPVFVNTPVAPYSDSLSSRRAKLSLDENGTLEGDVRLAYTGHSAVSRRWAYLGQQPSEREEAVREQIKNRFGNAEITGIKLENLNDPAKPAVVTYHVKIPGYAESTGRRLFLRPSYFLRNYAPRFTTSERIYPVVFEHPWVEKDLISIDLPVGFTLENAESPQPLNMGAVGGYQATLKIDKEKGTLYYERTFAMGENGSVAFPAASYKPLKQAFDLIQESDNHTVTLQQSALRVK